MKIEECSYKSRWRDFAGRVVQFRRIMRDRAEGEKGRKWETPAN
jgi:hypothetical protein